MTKVLGIDLGTSSSAAAILHDGQVRLIPSLEKNDKTIKPFSSVVSFFEDGSCIIGSAALEQSVYNPKGTIFNVKRKMGTLEKIKIFDKEYLPQFISALFLMKIKIDTEKFLNEKITKAVITVPANFNDIQRQATKDAGKIAGLDVVRLLTEPVAATIAYGAHKISEPSKILVFDMGAGTLDVSIVEADKRFFEVIATSGPTNLGGINMDEEIENWLLSEFKKQNGNDVLPDEQSLAQIKELAKSLKIELSDKEQISFDQIITLGESQTKLTGNISRQTFEELIGYIVDESEIVINDVLKAAELTNSDIDKVILVGGPTKIPAIKKLVTRTVKEPEVDIDPDFVVASGAAIEGAILGDDQNLPVTYQGLTLLNVTPLDLGEFAKEKDESKIILMIPKNTPYPTENTRKFYVNKIMQTEVQISIWQGNFEINPSFAGNVNIGIFVLSGLRPGVQNEIEVTYGIDDNGILAVSAKEIETDTEDVLVVDRVWEQSGPPPQLEVDEEKLEKIEKHYRYVMSPYEIPVGEYTKQEDPESKKLCWMCDCLSEAKNIIKQHHNELDPSFFDYSQFELFLQLDIQYAYAYIQLTGGPVYPIGIHNSLKEETNENKRMLVITLVHELLHAIHPDWGHNKIRPEERRLANLAGYFDTYRNKEVKFLSGQMSLCNNTMTHSEQKVRIQCK